MRNLFGCFSVLSLLLVAATSTLTAVECDCHLYAVNMAELEKIVDFLENGPGTTEERMENIKSMAATSNMRVGEFKANLGEEDLIIRSFPIPGTGLVATATLFLTDETMASADSLWQALVVGPVAVPNAIHEPGGAITEVSVDIFTYKVLTKQKVMVEGRMWTIGIECQLLSDENRRALGKDVSEMLRAKRQKELEKKREAAAPAPQ